MKETYLRTRLFNQLELAKERRSRCDATKDVEVIRIEVDGEGVDRRRREGADGKRGHGSQPCKIDCGYCHLAPRDPMQAPGRTFEV